jgi:hypothetical protein
MQQDWWQNCWNYLFKATQPTQKPKNITSIESIDFLNEQFFNYVQIDSKKQNDLVRILELIRLKSQTVKLETGKFKLETDLCINVARNLQYWVDNFEKTTTQETTQSSLNKNSPSKFSRDLYKTIPVVNIELKYSPKEKLMYLKRYALAYWEFTAKRLIKMKQLSVIDSESVEKCQQRLSIGSIQPKVEPSLYKSYFNYVPRKWDEDKENYTEKEQIEYLYQNMIEMGIFYSILSRVDSENEDKDFSNALAYFELLEENFKERSMSELMFNKLDMCKQIAEHLIKNRDSIEFIRIHSPKRFEEERLAESAAQVQLLIEYIKKEISLSFKNNLNTQGYIKNVDEQNALSELNASLNKSISESKREIEIASKEQENQSTLLQLKEEKEKAIHDQIEEELRIKSEEIELIKQEEDKKARQIQDETNQQSQQRVVNLIETLIKQRSEHLKINIEILKDQFLFLNSQFKQIKNEIASFRNCSARRQVR